MSTRCQNKVKIVFDSLEWSDRKAFVFVKLFSQVVSSSLTEKEPIDVRGVFFMLMASADKDGNVLGSDATIARIINVPLAQFSAALEALMKPDASSNSKDHEGRRVIRLEGTPGLLVVNYRKYAGIASDEQRREYFRVKKAESRAREKKEPALAPAEKPEKWHKDARTVLHLLNEATGRHFRETEDNCSRISARLSEPGVDLEGVKKMIARQCQRWKNDPKMAEYLQPSTLFGKEKFDNYYSARDLPVIQEPGPGGYGDSGGVEQGEAYNERLRKAGRLIEGGAGPAKTDVATDTPPEPERKTPYERPARGF